MSDHRVLRRVAELRDRALADVTALPSAGRPADELGLHYATAAVRYNLLNDLHAEIAELLKQGDDLD